MYLCESAILRIIVPVGTHHIVTRFDQVTRIWLLDEVGVYVDVKLYAEYMTPTIILEPPCRNIRRIPKHGYSAKRCVSVFSV